MSKKPPRIRLTPVRQFDSLAGAPSFEGQLGPNSWIAAFDLRPTPASRSYRVQITFLSSRSPQVHVLFPDMYALANGRKLPHVYLPLVHPAQLCLFHPVRDDWARHLRVSETIVPWTAEWLLHFELWLATNTWRGGGQHPTGRDRESHSARLQERWRHQSMSHVRKEG